MILRPYQQKTIDQIYDYLRLEDGNPCVVLPTGAGKSVVIGSLVKTAVQDWPQTKVLMLVHSRELIQQNFDKLVKLWPNAPVAIYSAGLNSKQTDSITYAGIQSIHKKADILGHIDLVLADECHLISHEETGMYRNLLSSLKSINPLMRVVGFTATPFRLGHGKITDGEAIFDDLIEPVTIEELQSQGFLSLLRSKVTNEKLSVQGVHKRGGEYIESELQKAVDKEDINSAIVEEIISYAENRKHWLIFCTGVNHAYNIRDQFLSRLIPAATITGATPLDERDELLRKFKAGEIKVLTNCDILCLDEKTEILTSDGFVGMNEMSYGHKIAAWKEDGNIDFSYPENITIRERKENEKMVVFGGGVSPEIRVTENHRMVVCCGDKRENIKVKKAIDMVGKSFSIPAYGFSYPEKKEAITPEIKSDIKRQISATAYNYRKKGIEKKEARKKSEEQALRMRSMRYKNPDELTLDECEFIGFWLGDGTISNGRCSVTQSMAYSDIVEHIENLINKINLHYTKSITKKRENMTADAIRFNFSRGTGGDFQYIEKGFFSIEPYLNKNGTKLFYGLNKEQLLKLLDGLWLADGNHHGKKRGGSSKYISVKFYELVSILQECCSMRGISTVLTKKSKPKNDSHSQMYYFSWGTRKRIGYIKGKSYIEYDYKKEKVWCVASKTSYIICRRKGKVFVIGNSTGFDFPDIDLIAMLRPTMSPVLYVQQAGRGLRVKSHTDHCLILDFAGVVAQHGPITMVQAPVKNGSGDGVAPIKYCDKCREILYAGVRVCTNCGYEFPPPEKDPLYLRDDDIQGNGIIESRVFDWDWRLTESKKGNKMVVVSYYTGVAERINEYLLLWTPGFPGKKAMDILEDIAKNCGLGFIPPEFERMEEGNPPYKIKYKMEGKYPRIIEKIWFDEAEVVPF